MPRVSPNPLSPIGYPQTLRVPGADYERAFASAAGFDASWSELDILREAGHFAPVPASLEGLILNQEPGLYLPLTEDTWLADYSGNVRTVGAAGYPATVVPGIAAAEFSGNNGGVTTNYTGAFAVGSDRTYMCNAYIASGTADYRTLFAPASAWTSGLAAYFRPASNGFELYRNGTLVSGLSVTNVPNDRWFHFAVVWSTTNSLVSVYVDGALSDTAATAALPASPTAIVVGADPAISYSFRGSLAHFAAVEDDLTAAQVAEIAGVSLRRFA